MSIIQNHTFIDYNDDLGRLINIRANHLYNILSTLDISNADIDAFGKYYFTNHHAGNRLVFSIESSADIIYNSVKNVDKPVSEIFFIDYGAGLGTLFLLAGLVGFKKVYFNDYFPQWANYAKIICNKLNIKIDGFISGDIDAVIEYGKTNDIRFDIIASRNVVEHIYNLRDFYTKIFQSGITNICYATTTANYHNPAMRLKHYWHHYQLEKTLYKNQRADHIRELIPNINTTDLNELVKLTRGKAFEDFDGTLDLYLKKQPVQAVEFLGTNTCDCKTGVWAEHLITKRDYENIIQQAGFDVEYKAGFWDTHYKYQAVNLFAGMLNKLITLMGKKGYYIAPFVNIIANKNK